MSIDHENEEDDEQTWASIDVQNIHTRGALVDMKSDMRKRQESVSSVGGMSSPDIIEDLEGELDKEFEEKHTTDEEKTNEVFKVNETESLESVDELERKEQDLALSSKTNNGSNNSETCSVVEQESEIESGPDMAPAKDLSVDVKDSSDLENSQVMVDVNDEESVSISEKDEQNEIAKPEEASENKKVRKVSSHKMPNKNELVQTKVSGDSRTSNVAPQRPRTVKAVSESTALAKKESRSPMNARRTVNSPKSRKNLSKSKTSGSTSSDSISSLRDRSSSSASNASTVSQKSTSLSASQRSEPSKRIAAKDTKKESPKTPKSTNSAKPSSFAKTSTVGTKSSATASVRRSSSSVSAKTKDRLATTGGSTFQRNTPLRKTIATSGKSREELSKTAATAPSKANIEPSKTTKRASSSNISMKKSRVNTPKGIIRSTSSRSSDSNSVDSESAVDKKPSRNNFPHLRSSKTATSKESSKVKQDIRKEPSATSKRVTTQKVNMSSAGKNGVSNLRKTSGKTKSPDASKSAANVVPADGTLTDDSEPKETEVTLSTDTNASTTLQPHANSSTQNQTTPVKRAIKSTVDSRSNEKSKQSSPRMTVDKENIAVEKEEKVGEFTRSRSKNLSLPPESRRSTNRKGSLTYIPPPSNSNFSRAKNASLPATYRKSGDVTLRKKGEKKGTLSKIYKRLSWRGSTDHELSSMTIKEENLNTGSQQTAGKKTKKVAKTRSSKEPKVVKTTPSKHSTLEEAKPKKSSSSRLKIFGKSK